MHRLCVSVWLSLVIVSDTCAEEWHDVTVPDVWRQIPTGDLASRDGYSWYRTFVLIPRDWQGVDLTLFVEPLDDARSAWVNGTMVGINGRFPPVFRSGLGEPGRFAVPARIVRPGEVNCIAIRVCQNDPRTNFNVAPPVLLNRDSMRAIRMNGTWQYRPGDNKAWANPAILFDSAATFANVHHVNDVEQFVAWRKGDRDPLGPDAARQAFEIPDDLCMELVLSEPKIAQPLFMTWDERGRLWLIEYRQYPVPAGLTMVSRDIYLRTVYDRTPLPPPQGVAGRDRISIHEDTDGDGIYDKHRLFVDELNIATSVAVGRGGVFVTNPPYLLFYADRNGDDVPDSDPEVLLEGFGLEDTHSVISSIRFGPDGWLYGCQGSTVTANVKQPGNRTPPIRTMGQQIWRYHPERRIFEVFAEGGGNTFGLEIDEKGRIYSGHNGGDTRGFHYVQGGYYRKGFSKHGQLSNPYAFGYFEAMKHHAVPRFTHAFVIYQAAPLPVRYHGKLFGVEPLQGQVVLSDIRPHLSSFETRDIERVVRTDDAWFRPVDIKTGPDGCLYIADMYEQRIDHSSHFAGRIDRTNGRIWRLSSASTAARPAVRPDFASTKELLSALRHPDRWVRHTVVRLLGDQRDDSMGGPLFRQIMTTSGNFALASLWALHASGGMSQERTSALLAHEDEWVRAWTVRLSGDRRDVSAETLSDFIRLAAGDDSIHVRKQLASTARRLTATKALPIIRELVRHDSDVNDIHQPLLLWWAVESQAAVTEGQRLIFELLLDPESRRDRPLVRDHLVVRLMKRFVMSGSDSELLAAARLLRSASDPEATRKLMTALEEALVGRSPTHFPQELLDAMVAAGGGSLELRVRQKEPDAVQSALKLVTDGKVDLQERIRIVEALSDSRQPACVPALLSLLDERDNPRLIEAVLSALGGWSDEEIGRTLVARFSRLPREVLPAAASLAAARVQWTLWLLEASEEGHVDPQSLPESALRKMMLHPEPQIHATIRRLRGEIDGSRTDKMRAETAHLHQALAVGTGNPRRGKVLYMKNCGKCHRFFEEGGQTGPDLTAYQRSDLDRLIENVVNPNLEIREGFENFLVATQDGRLASGFLTVQDEQVIVLRSAEGINQSFMREEIETVSALKESVMPAGILDGLRDQEIRDLFAYLRVSQPVNY